MIAGVQSLLLDLDGCVWFGEELAPGAADLVAALRAERFGVGFLTNISSSRSREVADKLTRLGIPTVEREVLTPIDALANHPLLGVRPTVFVLGTDEVALALAEITAVTLDADEADLVVLGRDPRLDYKKMSEALHVLHRGGSLLALNLDTRVPVEGGRIVPGNGAIAAALEAASGVKAESVGKPSRYFFDAAIERFGFHRDTTLMVGDTLDSDIAGGAGAGLRTVLVGGSQFSLSRPPPIPDFAVAGIADLSRLFMTHQVTD